MKMSFIPSLPTLGRLAFVLILCLAVRVAVCQSEPSTADPSVDAVVVDDSADKAVAADKEITTGAAMLLKMKRGGWTIVFLLVVSVIGLATTLERLVHLRLGKISPPLEADKMEQLCRKGNVDEVAKTAAQSDSTLGRVVTAILLHRNDNSTDVSTLAGDIASREVKMHMLRAYPLMICATLSPLLGLFGTVAGMIGAFEKVAAAGSLGDASMLGGDISKALITTAAGLIVAIPALGLYHYFRSRTTQMAICLEERVSEIMMLLRSNDKANAGGVK